MSPSNGWDAAKAARFLLRWAASLERTASHVRDHVRRGASRQMTREDFCQYLGGLFELGLDVDPAEINSVAAASQVRACRVCGCTDEDCLGCIARTGAPCTWVEEDLCSACQFVPAAAEPRRSVCLTCGHSWLPDGDPRHSCASVLRGRLDLLFPHWLESTEPEPADPFRVALGTAVVELRRALVHRSESAAGKLAGPSLEALLEELEHCAVRVDEIATNRGVS